MDLNQYQIKINEQKEMEIREENLVEVLKFYVLFSKIEKLSFFEYNYDLNKYNYLLTVDSKNKFIEPHNIDDVSYSLILEEDGTIYGMITFDETPLSSEIVTELFDKIVVVVKKRFSLKKALLSREATIDIFIISDEKSIQYAKKLQGSLDILLNANLYIEETVNSILDKLKEKINKSFIIYLLDDEKLIKMDEEILKTLNEFLIVIGPSDYDLSLYCGRLNVYNYFAKDSLVPEQIKTVVVELKNKLQNKYLNKNILYIDLSTTKGISNLFLGENPMPQKTIIDLVNSEEFDIEDNLDNGLVKIRENFYAINGIQKHLDSDFLEQDVFIEKLLGYISKVSEEFNFIIIDTGEANARSLNTTIYDISNELWILTEMSLPHISKLKTFFSLMKRAGLKDKLTFLVNRYDSVNAISVSDVESILNTTNEDHLNFEFKIPNDYQVLGRCWNYCELASQTFPKSVFIEKLNKILLSKELIQQNKNIIKEDKKSLFSFFK